MFRKLVFAAVITIAVAAVSPASAAETCLNIANAVVKDAVEHVLNRVLEDHPDLKKLTQQELVKKAGNILLQAPKPDIQAYGFMMLMWYGDEADRKTVAQTAANLTTEAQRAHFYFVLGLAQIRVENADVAAQGRNYIRLMRDSGHITFVNDAMWTALLEECQLSQ